MAYLEQVSLMTHFDTVEDKKNAVTLMTVHIAKGLEFSTVFLSGLEESLFPLGEAQFDQDDLEEERRLAYVGMTRAKKNLFLTGATSRKLFGKTHWSLPSRFIEEAGLKLPLLEQKSSLSQPETMDYETRSIRRERRELRSPFRVGERVHHRDFGTGWITAQTGSGEDLKVVVEFDAGGWKKLLVKHAPLQRV
jgi:DNA helicase-2/ATP-dependent DNA helicase PcrA